MKRKLLAVGFLLAVFSAQALDDRLTLTLWSELEPMIVEGDEHPVSPETAAERLLEEARIFVSAMIYGYRFAYTPSDLSRGVPDRFELEPVAEIPWGDANLRILHTELRDDRIVAQVTYSMQPHHQNRRLSWSSNTIPLSGGKAEDSLIRGQSARLEAFRQAVKQAVREYARTRYFSKPREIAGDVLLWTAPYTVIAGGAYSTQLIVKLRIDEHTPYRVF